MSTLASKIVTDAVDVSFTDDELIVTLADARRVPDPVGSAPLDRPKSFRLDLVHRLDILCPC